MSSLRGDKFVRGKVGIHRPYFDAPPAGDVGAQLQKLIVASKAYFAEMNIPVALVDDMFSVPPEQMRILSQEELMKYRLNVPDFVFSEQATLGAMARLGMNREQYSHFVAKLNARCTIFVNRPPEMRQCVAKVLSEQNARR